MVRAGVVTLFKSTLTSGKDNVWSSDDEEGGRPSRASLSKCDVWSPGVCDGESFLGEGLRLLSELGVAGVRLTKMQQKSFSNVVEVRQLYLLELLFVLRTLGSYNLDAAPKNRLIKMTLLSFFSDHRRSAIDCSVIQSNYRQRKNLRQGSAVVNLL